MEKRSAVLEKATRAWSSCATQQHSSFTLFSHTLVAAVCRPRTNWLASGLNTRLVPAGENRATFRPSGSKTTMMVTTVEPMMIQLQNRGPGHEAGGRGRRRASGGAALQDLAEASGLFPLESSGRGPRVTAHEDPKRAELWPRPAPALTPQGLRVLVGETKRIDSGLTSLQAVGVHGALVHRASAGDGPEAGSAAPGGKAGNGTVSMAAPSSFPPCLSLPWLWPSGPPPAMRRREQTSGKR